MSALAPAQPIDDLMPSCLSCQHWHPLESMKRNVIHPVVFQVVGMDDDDSAIARVMHWGLLGGRTGAATRGLGGGTKWWNRLGGGARQGTATSWVVAQELLSRRVVNVMAQCQVLEVAVGGGGQVAKGPGLFCCIKEN